MIALKIALGIFALLETLNVILLYKKPISIRATPSGSSALMPKARRTRR
jgi:hypothetical protein